MTIKVISGELKGRTMPFQNKKFDDADITPQKVKGAIFSKIGEFLYGKSFFDLFAGCGQIGIEALSRGADPVYINEPDKKRFNFIKTVSKEFNIEKRTVLMSYDYNKAIDYAGTSEIFFDYIYIDPPYDKSNTNIQSYNKIIHRINEKNILKSEGIIIVQHFSMNDLNKIIGSIILFDSRKYGNTTLSFYRKF